jgi:hypothetical protein
MTSAINSFLQARITLGEGWPENQDRFARTCRDIRRWKEDFRDYGVRPLDGSGIAPGLSGICLPASGNEAEA